MKSCKVLCGTTLLAGLGFLVACSEGGLDNGPLAPGVQAPGPQAPGAQAGLIVPPAKLGEVTICKDAPSGSFDFSVSQDGTEGTISDASPSLTGGSCVTVWTDDSETTPIDPATMVTVTEAAQTGWQLDAIDVTGPPIGSSTNVGTREAQVTVNGFHGAVITFTNSEVFVPGNQGCTPGFWKNNTGQWEGTGFAPGDDFDTVFAVNLFNPDITLLQALKLHGGGVNAMARHAVAALLNAANSGVDAALSEAQVITLVQDAEAGGTKGDFTSAKNTLEAANELGCPLSADESNK